MPRSSSRTDDILKRFDAAMEKWQSPRWQELARMRKRGQKPALPVFVKDGLASSIEAAEKCFLFGEVEGVMTLTFPGKGQEEAIVGLHVVMLANKYANSIEMAQRLATAKPKTLTVVWRSRPDGEECEVQRVI